MDQPRDERSLYCQGCSLASVLVIAAAPRDFWIGRLECWHALPSSSTRNGSATIRRSVPIVKFRQLKARSATKLTSLPQDRDGHRNDCRWQRFVFHGNIHGNIHQIFPRRAIISELLRANKLGPCSSIDETLAAKARALCMRSWRPDPAPSLAAILT